MFVVVNWLWEGLIHYFELHQFPKKVADIIYEWRPREQNGREGRGVIAASLRTEQSADELAICSDKSLSKLLLSLYLWSPLECFIVCLMPLTSVFWVLLLLQLKLLWIRLEQIG